MVIKTDKRKIDNTNAIYNNVNKIINGDQTTNIYETNIFQINQEKSYETITNKVDYNDFFKKYINKFEELDNYAYNLVFPYFKHKNYDFTSTPLILGKKWSIGYLVCVNFLVKIC